GRCPAWCTAYPPPPPPAGRSCSRSSAVARGSPHWRTSGGGRRWRSPYWRRTTSRHRPSVTPLRRPDLHRGYRPSARDDVTHEAIQHGFRDEHRVRHAGGDLDGTLGDDQGPLPATAELALRER